MNTTPSILDILRHTPVWVWGLLAGLIALGLTQAVPRRVGRTRAALLPLAMLGWSLANAALRFDSGLVALALPAWALGAAASSAIVAQLPLPQGTRWAAHHLHVAGSWLPMALILAMFTLGYALGVTLALHPALRADAALAGGASLAFGGFSGIFAGRALALLQLARGAAAAPASARPA